MASHRVERPRERVGSRTAMEGSPTDDDINEWAITLAITEKLFSGVGYLALTWSTVVILGGFVGALQLKEFWFLTTVSLVIASTILAIYDYNLDSILEAVPNSFFRLLHGISMIMGIKEENEGCCISFKLICGQICILLLQTVWLLILVLILVVLIINLFGPMVSMVISMKRLIQHDYDGSDAANKGKLRAALFIFYCLALVHGVCFYFWLLLQEFLERQFGVVSTQCGFGEWGPEVVRGYYKETRLKCANDLRLPTGWNLVAYAVGLLDSLSRDDNLSGVRILDTEYLRKTKCIRLELSSSKRAIQNLTTMLGWTCPILDVQEIRERAARIMADISSELHIARFPGALQSVSSLLEASPQKRHQEALGLSVQGSEHSSQITASRDPNQQVVLTKPSPSSDAGTTQENTTDDSRQRKSQLVRKQSITFQSWIQRRNERRRDRTRKEEEERAFKPKGTKELILQGLLILERLAYDEHNCREIVNTQGLLSKITAPITSQAFLDAHYDETWVSILSSSLRVVSRLISAPGEAGTRLRQEFSASEEPIHNMLWILQGNTNGSEKLQEPAIEILTELALGPTDKTKNFGKTLGCIFLDKSGANRLRRKAGEALAKLLSTKSASGLTPVMKIFCESVCLDVFNGTCVILVNELVDALVKDKECQISAAEILEYLCFRLERYRQLSKKIGLELLTKILGIILSMNTERKADQVAGSDSGNITEVESAGAVTGAGASNNSVIESDEESQPPKDADQNDEQSEERKLVAALLSLTVVICNKLIDANDSCFVVLVDGVLIKKLKDIIDRNIDTTAVCLRIVKLTCQVVIAMMQLKPICIKEFEKRNFKKVLSKALKTLSDLDNCMLFAGNDRELTKPARSLASLVKEAHQLFNEAQEPGINSA